jgi:hypothetical protein
MATCIRSIHTIGPCNRLLPVSSWDLTIDAPREAQVHDAHASELRRECGPDHELAGRQFQAAAKCVACDHVVFELDNEQWAVVHLTWTANSAGWPHVEAIGHWDEVCAAVVEHARLHQ